MSKRIALPGLLLVVIAGAAACSAGAAGSSPSPSTSPASSPPSPAVAGIAHPTGATDIVLRFDESGGFVPPEFLAAHVPLFTLYGDGTVVFVSSAPVPARADNISVGQAVRTGRMTEADVQALLEYALRDGGLAIARADYQNPLVADAPTAVFQLNADGAQKTVSVVALGMDDQQVNADTAIRKSLAQLGARLRDFDQGGSVKSTAFAPSGYRGVLLEQQGLQGVAFREWPWKDIAPADFAVPKDPNALQQGTKVLTPDQARALGVDGFESGIASGIFLRDDAGKTYSFVLRPLLPDETA